MYGYAPSFGDVADDGVAGDGIATAGQVGEQIPRAEDGDLGRAFLPGGSRREFPFLAFHLQEPGGYLLWVNVPVADGGQEILGAFVAEYPGRFLVIHFQPQAL